MKLPKILNTIAVAITAAPKRPSCGYTATVNAVIVVSTWKNVAAASSVRLKNESEKL
jgi:glutaredoxin-related protein